MDSWISDNNTIIENTSNVITQSDNDTLQYKKTFDIKMPKSEAAEYKIAINSSVLKKLYTCCDEIENNKFSWAELFLSISTLFFGAFLSALLSSVPYEIGFLNILFYSVSPVIGAVCLAGWFFCRGISMKDAHYLVTYIKENIPNPTENEGENKL